MAIRFKVKQNFDLLWKRCENEDSWKKDRAIIRVRWAKKKKKKGSLIRAALSQVVAGR